jgi:hypothetical protein
MLTTQRKYPDMALFFIKIFGIRLRVFKLKDGTYKLFFGVSDYFLNIGYMQYEHGKY